MDETLRHRPTILGPLMYYRFKSVINHNIRCIRVEVRSEHENSLFGNEFHVTFETLPDSINIDAIEKNKKTLILKRLLRSIHIVLYELHNVDVNNFNYFTLFIIEIMTMGFFFIGNVT